MSHPNKPIFDKLLVANRGEIACRVMRTCKRMGIKTVAVYSTADEQAKHVRMADERVCIGPAPSRDSYLKIDAVIDACLKTKANAVHPGYGFLSENGDFSAALKKAGIIFVGPDAESIEAMGDKVQSKAIAREANVTTIPGYIGYITTHKELLDFSNQVGYPVMVKASGGGGGKGMRVAYNDKECVEFYETCKAEAISAFNNDKMLVEKFIESPRHIEVQIIADRCGNTVYLPERECSIQRRNQKVIEEAPSRLIDPATRKAMGEQAAALARKVNYVTAGTVEMVVNPKREFFFLEMNTRLQVEHPITELITGVDLVEQMIRASAGLPLSVKQEDIKVNGWATECRICAEDPTKNYFPSIGRVSQYQEPHGEGIRVDTGIVEGSQISVYYDSLIAKLCTWAPTRDECVDKMRTSLDQYVIRGLKHNANLCRDVLMQQRYLDGDITTNYLPEQYPNGFKGIQLSPEMKERLFAVSAIVSYLRQHNEARVQTKQHLHGDQQPAAMEVAVGFSEDRKHQSRYLIAREGHFFRIGHGAHHTMKIKVDWEVDQPLIKAEFFEGNGAGLTEYLQWHGTDEISNQIQYMGTVFNVDVFTENQSKAIGYMLPPKFGGSLSEVTSPMPGVIVSLNVKPGDKIVAGTELLTLEAMKMRNKIRSEVDGTIKSIKVQVGQTVGDGDILVEFESKDTK